MQLTGFFGPSHNRRATGPEAAACQQIWDPADIVGSDAIAAQNNWKATEGSVVIGRVIGSPGRATPEFIDTLRRLSHLHRLAIE